MARKKIEKRQIEPDLIYNNILVSKLINKVMTGGKKSVARKIVYQAFEEIKNKTKKEPLEIFEKAIQNTSPLVEVKSKRVGGATYQVPREVKGDRKQALAMRWILDAAKSKKGKPMREKLAEELMEAAENKGAAMKKRMGLWRRNFYATPKKEPNIL